MRVTLQSGKRLMIYSPYFEGDTLYGADSPSVHALKRPRVAIPLDQVREVAIKQNDPVATTLLVVGVTVVVLILVVAMARSSESGSSGAFLPPDYNPISCPLLYSWDGSGWRLDSGTFGGAIARSLARTDVDNLDHATAERDTLRLKLANELEETDHVDLVELLAVNHEPGVTVAPDDRGALHTLVAPRAPVGARDFRGREALPRVRASDGWRWESVLTGRDPTLAADVRDGLELEFLRPPGAREGRLVVDGNNTPWGAFMLGVFVAAHGRATPAWYDSLEQDPDRARAIGAALAREAFLSVAVRTRGGWERRGLILEAGPEVIKRQVMSLDLGGCEGDTVRVRLETVPGFWQIDRVALDCAPPRPMTVTAVSVARAEQPGGRDVRDLLSRIDGRILTMERGESAELRFAVPPVPKGRARSYMARTHGWYRLHTDETREPDFPLLAGVTERPLGVSRTAVELTNRALRRLKENAR